MMTTEEEAKKKWCCAGMSSLESIKCLASECIAWRWSDTEGIDPALLKDPPGSGYCGMAGKVEL